jgi:NADH dehydrogenase FAD-containing subunit
MLKNNLLSSKFLVNNIKKNFSHQNHSKLIIVGGGTAGVTVAHQLIRDKVISNNDLTIFDKNSVHHYQPGWTKIASGVIESDFMINNYTKYKIQDLCKNFNYQNSEIKTINPENNSIETLNGDKWTYDNLIIAAGLKINLDGIPGIFITLNYIIRTKRIIK